MFLPAYFYAVLTSQRYPSSLPAVIGLLFTGRGRLFISYHKYTAIETTLNSPVARRMRPAVNLDSSLRTTKQLLYLYILLLIFEGALRKWVLPGLSGPLAIIRDPLALGIVIYYAATHKYFFNFYTIALTVVTTISFCATLAVGHGNFIVAVFGFRTIVLHAFVVFIMGLAFDREDVERVGRIFLYLAIPATILTILQFYSPQSAWVNRGIGGDIEGSGFSGAGGFFRPAGYFSFTNGNASYFNLVAAFSAYFMMVKDRCPGWLKIAGLLTVIIAIPISLSRGYAFGVFITAVAFIVASVYSSRALFSVFAVIIFSPLLFILLSQFEFFQTALDTLLLRFTQASAAEGSVDDTIILRIFGPMIEAFTGREGQSPPFFGLGLGLGTNFGAVLASGERTFLVAEFEWGRLVGEMGALLGLLIIILRVAFGAHLSLLSLRAVASGNSLPLMLLSASLINIVLGQWAQPTALGFFAVSAGLTLASLRSAQA